MAIYFRTDDWVKSAIGPAVPGAQIFWCLQPANVASYPPSPLAPAFSDPNGLVPITFPQISDGFGHTNTYLPAGVYTLVVALNGIIQQVYTDQTLGIGNAGPGNPYTAGANITIVGSVISAVIPPVAGVELQTNGVDNTSQTKLNLKNSASVTWVSDSLGGVTATAANQIPNTFSSVTGLGNWKGCTTNFNSASMSSYGSSAAPTFSGAVQVNATATESPMVGLQTTSTPSTSGGMNAAPALSNTYTIGSTLAFQTRAQLVQTTNVRVWIVWANTNASNPNAFQSDTPNTNFIGFRYSTSAGDTKWVCCAGTSNVLATFTPESGASHVNTNAHTFAFTVSGGGTSINYYIDDTLVGTINTNIPSTSQALSPCTFIDNVGLGSNQQVNVAYMAWSSKF